ncbi:hypothetical protein PPYR_05070 [Photinus pyralis]|uniref:C2H2-type domain-containing protein n=3 Tax=Photinus pyralis TaxID=7054 RepID=A0A5N4AZX6_PHOPY|nr:zinc finger protein GLIS2 homolog [Photinus pyralis]KAB0802884.1 hypothetical protein PPYR_05070 [Photinus pyralis]
MIVYNHRMLEGDPLQYYTTGLSIPAQPSYFSYFNRFQSYDHLNMSEELLMPHSPNGSQSDSDNSISSLEPFPKDSKLSIIKKSEQVQCCWSSCGIIFESLDQLAIHVSRVHSASGPGGLFYCGWKGCTRNNKGFNARYKMLVHVRTHTNEKPHHCYQCDKSFSRAENLKIHSRSHSGEKPYVCPVPGCHKAYSNSSDRFKHTRTHQVDKPYQCKVPGCPKRYTDPSSLRKHVKTYKHFVSENGVSAVNIKTSVIVTNKKVESHLGAINESCDSLCTCKHLCCASKDSGVLKLDGYINIRNNHNTSTWNKTAFIPEPKLFRPYQIDDKMEIDLPLDLSIARRHI